MTFRAKTWNNGHYHASGAGYGLKISLEERARFFNRDWNNVILHLDGYRTPVNANVRKASFWNNSCGELIKKDIGLWLQQNNRDRWPLGMPYEVRLTVVKEHEFKVELI